ncbi:MAG TPA: hypothetical protein VMI54_12155 [Polyangiaceae bacterium]|nr:hypothetical protein [Polyangiaceae bacterium]
MSDRIPTNTLSALLAGMSALDKPHQRLPCRVLAYRESIPSGLSGSFVAVAGGGRSFQVGVLCDLLGWPALAQAVGVQALRPSESPVQAAAELATFAARGLIVGLPGVGALSFGMPLFVDGSVAVGKDTDVHAADVVFASTRALVVLLERKR